MHCRIPHAYRLRYMNVKYMFIHIYIHTYIQTYVFRIHRTQYVSIWSPTIYWNIDSSWICFPRGLEGDLIKVETCRPDNILFSSRSLGAVSVTASKIWLSDETKLKHPSFESSRTQQEHPPALQVFHRPKTNKWPIHIISTLTNVHIQNFYIKTFKIAPTCFDPKIIFRELHCSLLKLQT